MWVLKKPLFPSRDKEVFSGTFLHPAIPYKDRIYKCKDQDGVLQINKYDIIMAQKGYCQVKKLSLAP